jgi:RimJ/RimL family protein N-acetyltransferase
MISINNDKNCKIRTGELKDAETLLEISNFVVSEGEYFIVVSEELENSSLEEEREQIQKIINNERETLIVAEIDGVVVGSIKIRSNRLKRMSHTGTISMSLGKDYRGMGIGKLLLQALLDWAEKHPLIEKVNLGVFSTNHRAISLYKSMGFIEEGRLVKEYKINENTYIDDVLMYKCVK